jgi:pimeloyl-ACP methyl ester carboxylesterase
MKYMTGLVIAAVLMAGPSATGAATESAKLEESRMSVVAQGLRSGYVTINGMEVYYEVHGQGKPLLLLHGGITATQTVQGTIDELSKSRRVIALHAQGHGNTADIDRPYAYESLADDVAAFVKHMKLERIDLVGYSFGGGIALQTAIRHPETVERLVVISAPMARSGFYPEVIAAFEQMPGNAAAIATNLKASPLASKYPKTDWEATFRKMGLLHSKDYNWSGSVPAIKNPTLLIFADADSVQVEHIAAFYKALGGAARDAGLDGSHRSPAQLAIIPGATHYDIVSKPALAAIVGEFLGI